MPFLFKLFLLTLLLSGNSYIEAATQTSSSPSIVDPTKKTTKQEIRRALPINPLDLPKPSSPLYEKKELSLSPDKKQALSLTFDQKRILHEQIRLKKQQEAEILLQRKILDRRPQTDRLKNPTLKKRGSFTR